MSTPVTDLMHGAQWAKYYVNTYLNSDLPNRINRYRSGWNLDSNELPTPEFFLTYEPIALDHLLSIITVCLSSSPFERLMQGVQGDPFIGSPTICEHISGQKLRVQKPSH